MTTPNLSRTSLIGLGWAPNLAGGGRKARLAGLTLGSPEVTFEGATQLEQDQIISEIAGGFPSVHSQTECSLCAHDFTDKPDYVKYDHILVHASHRISGITFGAKGLAEDAIIAAFDDLDTSALHLSCISFATGYGPSFIQRTLKNHEATTDYGTVKWTAGEVKTLSQRFVKRFNLLDDEAAVIGGINVLQQLMAHTDADPNGAFNGSTATATPKVLYKHNVSAARSRLSW